MARVATTIHAKIEHALQYLFDEWTDVPEVAAEWPDMELPERMTFILEWPIRESYMAQLRDYAKRGLLTTTQRGQYEELLRLAEKHRPIVELLLKG